MPQIGQQFDYSQASVIGSVTPQLIPNFPEFGLSVLFRLTKGSATVRLYGDSTIVATIQLPKLSGELAGEMQDQSKMVGQYSQWHWEITAISGGGTVYCSANVLEPDAVMTAADMRNSTVTGGAVSSVAGKTGAVTLVKADVGLGNVDNTADANKPVSTAQAAADAAVLATANSNMAAIPTHLGAVANQAGMLAVSGAVVGDTVLRTDTGTDWRLDALPASTLANWRDLGASSGAPAGYSVISGTTHTLSGANTRLFFTGVSCLVTAPDTNLANNLVWELRRGPAAGVVTVQMGGVAAGWPAGPWTIDEPGGVLSVATTPTNNQYAFSRGFDLNSPFPNETAMNAFAAANPLLMVANVTRAWVGFQQYGWDGTAFQKIGGNLMTVLDFTTSAFKINGVAQAGSGPVWTTIVPNNVRQAEFHGTSAGGGGGGGAPAGVGGGGGGGGSGNFTQRPIPRILEPSETLTITMPTPGAGGAAGSPGGSSSGPLTVVGSVSGLIFFLPQGGSNGAAGTSTNGGGGGNGSEQTGFNLAGGGSSGTGAGAVGTAVSSSSGGNYGQSTGASGGGATGTNAGGNSAPGMFNAIQRGGNGANTYGGGAGGGVTPFSKISGGGAVTGGSNASPNAVTLTEATHGYGLGGPGGAAHATTPGAGGAGTGSFLRITYN